MVDSIIRLLKELKDVYSRLYELSQKKQRLIVENKAEEVSEIVKQEWELMSEAADLETLRGEEVERLIPGKKSGKIAFADITALAGDAEKEELKALSSELANLLTEQKKINDQNQSLIELHLEYMDYMINNVLREPQVSNIYGNSGTELDTDTKNKGIIDSEV